MERAGRNQARWLIVALLIGAAVSLWELGADASRVRVVVRFLAGQSVSLGSASASDNYMLTAYLGEVIVLGAGLVLFLQWRRARRTGPGSVRSVVAVWWTLWIGANIVGRLVELSYRATSSLTDIRNVTLIDAADTVALALSLLAMAALTARVERRSTVRRAVPAPAKTRTVQREGTAPGADAVAAAPRSRRQSAGIAAVAALLVVAPLAVGFLVSNGTMQRPRPVATPGPSQSAAWQASNAASTHCPDAMFKPSGALAAGVSSACANVTLGSSLFSADCATGKIPADLSPEVFDNTGQASALGTVAAATSGCTLTTKSTSVTSAVLAGDSTGPVSEPGAVVIIADFIPASDPSGLNTVGVRVSSTNEFDVALQSGGQYAVIESTGGSAPVALLQGTLSASQAVTLDLSREVRVVVAMKGTTAAAYVNGLLLGTGPTAVPDAPGGCGFSLSTNDATHPAVAKLVQMEIFATG